jgi:thioredoxin 1
MLAVKYAPVAERRVEHVDHSSFRDQVLRSDVPVLVDFYADWCGPCRLLAPVLDELARELPEARIVKVNIDHSPELASAYGVEAVPTLLLIRDGEAVGKHVGLASKAALKRALSRPASP